MFHALVSYFANILSGGTTTTTGMAFLNQASGFGNLSYLQYLSCLFALVSFVTIFVLCCLFVYKIIKLIGGLIR